MAQQLIVTIPAGDPALRRAIEQGVEEYADVHQPQSYTDPETVKLVLEIVGQGVSIAGGIAGILTFIRSLKQEQARQGRTVNITIAVPGRAALPVESADAELLARLLAADPRG